MWYNKKVEKENNKEHVVFLNILLGGCVIAIISSFYFYYFKQDYNFIVETNCDPAKEVCFYRDCTNPDDCPPNGLTHYNTYTLRASDYKYCENEDCYLSCTTGKIKCEKTECTKNDFTSGTCVGPTSSNTDNLPK